MSMLKKAKAFLKNLKFRTGDPSVDSLAALSSVALFPAVLQYNCHD